MSEVIIKLFFVKDFYGYLSYGSWRHHSYCQYRWKGLADSTPSHQTIYLREQLIIFQSEVQDIKFPS